MKLSDGTYLCPFCLSSTICEGPHIKEHEESNLKEFMYYAKVDHLEIVLEEIKKYQIESGIDLAKLAMTIKNRLMGRDK
jgi:hypothetical protein